MLAVLTPAGPGAGWAWCGSVCQQRLSFLQLEIMANRSACFRCLRVQEASSTAAASATAKAPAAVQQNGSSSKPPAGVSTPPVVEPSSRVSTASSGPENEPEHKGAEPPLNEEDRMDYLCKLGVLDTVRCAMVSRRFFLT